jgi:hypothetical protein
MSTGTNWMPLEAHRDWIWGQYRLVSSSRSPSIPLKGEEKKTRQTLGSFSLLALLAIMSAEMEKKINKVTTPCVCIEITAFVLFSNLHLKLRCHFSPSNSGST